MATTCSSSSERVGETKTDDISIKEKGENGFDDWQTERGR